MPGSEGPSPAWRHAPCSRRPVDGTRSASDHAVQPAVFSVVGSRTRTSIRGPADGPVLEPPGLSLNGPLWDTVRLQDGSNQVAEGAWTCGAAVTFYAVV